MVNLDNFEIYGEITMHFERVDDCCREIYGHTNWAYFDTLSAKEKKKALKDENVIVFYKDPLPEEEI